MMMMMIIIIIIIMMEIIDCEISAFRREVSGNCALLGCYTACKGNSLPTFRDSVSVPSSRVENPKIGLSTP